MPTFQEEKDSLYSLEAATRINLYKIDLSSIGFFLIRYFHQYNTAQDVFFQGNQYLSLPLKAEGLERSSAAPPSPKLTLGNGLGGWLSKYLIEYRDLLGAEVTRYETLPAALGQPANPNWEIRKNVFIIDRLASETAISVTFEMKVPYDYFGLTWPGKTISKYRCQAEYRSAECGYTGTNSQSCDLSIRGCEQNFGVGNILNINALPGADLVQS